VITSLFITGIALDTVVYYTALDAVSLGYRVFVFVPRNLGFSSKQLYDLNTKGVKIISPDQINDSFQLDNSAYALNKLEGSFLSWNNASLLCSPNRLCNGSEICANSKLFQNTLSPNIWIPSGDFPNAWVSFDNNCSINSNNPLIISAPGGVPIMCCYLPTPPSPSNTSPLPSPANSTSPSPLNITTPLPSPANSILPSPVNSTSPSPLNITTPLPSNSIPPSPANTTLPSPVNSSPVYGPRVHVDVPNDVGSTRELTRVASVVLISLGAGLIVGVAVGCLFGKRRANLT